MSSTDTPVICSECGTGTYRSTGRATFECTSCDRDPLRLADFDDAWFDYRRDVILAMSERTVDVVNAVREATGITLEPWDMAGGCYSLGADLGNGRELLVSNGDAGLPDDEEIMRDHGGSLAFCIATEDDEPTDVWTGNDLDMLAERVAAAIKGK
jgi:hypothetical protein